MSGLCDMALAAGLTLMGLCADDAGQSPVAPLPPEDDAVFQFREPEPEPAPVIVPAPPPPAMPPVIVKKTVERVVVKEKRVPAPRNQETQPTVSPSKMELALSYALALRQARQTPLPAYQTQTVAAPLVAPQIASPAAAVGQLTPPVQTASLTPSDPPRYQAEGRTSSQPIDNRRILAADRYITGIIETGINTQLSSEDGGSVIIQTTRDVYGYHGRIPLIPRGSRMICGFVGVKKQGLDRFGFVCKRILLGGTRVEIFDLASRVGDMQGTGGITGEVDNRWWEKYGTAVILSGISATVQAAASLSSNSAGSNSNTQASAAQEAAATLSERFGEISASVLENTVQLAPIIKAEPGTRVQIRPNRDWYIALPEERNPRQ